MKQNETRAELFFLEAFNADTIFRSIERKDFLFLFYIQQCSQAFDTGNRVYLSDLAQTMGVGYPELAEAMKRLNEKGYLSWETDLNLGKTYVVLSEMAIQNMKDESQQMKKAYEMIQREIKAEDLELTVNTLRKIRMITQNPEESAE